MLQGSFNKYSKPLIPMLDKLFQKTEKEWKPAHLMSLVWPWFQNLVRTVQENIEPFNFKILNIILDNQNQFDFLKNSWLGKVYHRIKKMVQHQKYLLM